MQSSTKKFKNKNNQGVRIGVGPKNWELVADSCFSAGTSIFKSKGVDADRKLTIEVIEGPLKGYHRK